MRRERAGVVLTYMPTCAVARACVGLAFPRRTAADVDRLLSEKRFEMLPKWREDVPEVPQAPSRIVHLDIDTSNGRCPAPRVAVDQGN